MKTGRVVHNFFLGRAPSDGAHTCAPSEGSRYPLQACHYTPSHHIGKLFAAIAHATHGTKLIARCLVFISLLLSACSVQPEPLQFGKDVCHFCKMTLMDKKFGAELVTNKGKVYRFDDLNCMLNFYNSGYEEPAAFQFKLVVDFNNPGQLIDATNAFYLKSSALRTPMGSEVAAFESKSSLDAHKKEIKGIFLAWGEVVTQYK